MKKLLFLCLLAFPFLSYANEYEDETLNEEIVEYSFNDDETDCCAEWGWFDSLLSREYSLQGRIAWFQPTDSHMRRVYRHNWADYEFELETPLHCHWSLWLNGSYYDQKGRSLGLGDSTRVKHQAYNLGVKHYFHFLSQKPLSQRMRPYLGFGMGAAQVRFHDESTFVSQHTSRWGFALLAKAGIELDLSCNFFLDGFVDYTYEWFHFKKHTGVSRHDINPGGVKVGAGIGYKF
jgi:outer membrane protein